MSTEPPPHSTRGLLEGIADTALDDDYYEVRSGDRTKPSTRTFVTAVGTGLFALLVTVAVIQTRDDRPGNQIERNTLVSNIQDRKDKLNKREKQANRLLTEVAKLQALSNRSNPEYEDLRMTTADRGASGPGIVITVDNSPENNTRGRVTDIDMQILVNGLWYAGAEAISINGNRIGTLSSIRKAGEAITVNFRSIVAPYRITVLGNNDSLADRLGENPGGQYWATRTREAGLRFSVKSEDRLTVPAAPVKRVSIVHAEAIEGES